ncbi:MAG: peptide chain release factor N(5)-glutamine methyltransferase [Mariprofundus sp.]
MPLTIRELLHDASRLLKEAGCDAPRLDAELLLMHVWPVSRTDLIIRSGDTVPEGMENSFRTLVKRRCRREPLAYITGEKEFWSRPFHVTPDVLIPRPETEHLIEAVLEYFPNRNDNSCFCDIGTGSGCIAVTLACEYPNARIVATDISDAALDIARHNAEKHAVADRITFRQGDMLSAFQKSDGPFHGIISNPPYVAEAEMDELEKELSQEPRHALTDGQDGLEHLTTILCNGPAYLQTGGYIMLETGSCGLPDTPDNLTYQQSIHDLAGLLRGGIYHLPCA